MAHCSRSILRPLKLTGELRTGVRLGAPAAKSLPVAPVVPARASPRCRARRLPSGLLVFLEARQPLPHRSQRRRFEIVDLVPAVAPRHHQTRFAQDPQVPGDRRPAGRKMIYQLGDRSAPIPKQLEDRQPRGIGQSSDRCRQVCHARQAITLSLFQLDRARTHPLAGSQDPQAAAEWCAVRTLRGLVLCQLLVDAQRPGQRPPQGLAAVLPAHSLEGSAP